MTPITPLTAVILAGGLARRMNHQDKGLVQFQGQPLISFAIAALSQLTPQLIINANRNHAAYQAFGYPVVADLSAHFDGPLAGILAAMAVANTEVLLVMPCDSPLFRTHHAEQLLLCREQHAADIAVAFDGTRIHPVFLALKTSLQASLQAYLASGERKLDRWLAQHQLVLADFSDEPDIFMNINTLSELAELEARRG